MRLLSQTPSQWAQVVLANFDQFLLDHAACERKASAVAMSLVAHYPDRKRLVKAMIDLAVEELEHFQQVYQWIERRNLTLCRDEKDHYVNELLKLVRRGSEYYLLDRLLIAGVIEARGCERFGLLANALPPGEAKEFYLAITRAEARHHGLFVRLAKEYFDLDIVEDRLAAILESEAQIVISLPFRAAVH